MRTTRIVAIATVVLLALVALPGVSAQVPPISYPRPPDAGPTVYDIAEALAGFEETLADLFG